LRTRAIPERLRGAFTTRRYTNPRLPLPIAITVEDSQNTYISRPTSTPTPKTRLLAP